MKSRLLAILAVLAVLGCSDTGRQYVSDVGFDVTTDFSAADTLLDVPQDTPQAESQDSDDSDQVVPDLLDARPDVPPLDVPPLDIGPDGIDDQNDSTTTVCDIKESLSPFGLMVAVEGEGYVDELLYDGTAYVLGLERLDTSSYYQWTLRLRMVDGQQVLAISAVLPLGQQIPVAVGEELEVRIVQTSGWWNDVAVLLSASDGIRAFVYDGDGLNLPSQGLLSVEAIPSDCSPVEGDCGLDTHPALAVSGPWGEAPVTVRQGDIVTLDQPGAHLKFYGIYQRITEGEVLCMDYPYQWFALAILGSRSVGQCHCNDSLDCRSSDVCETEVHRCVFDLCADLDCEFNCDPFTGSCFPDPPGVLYSCESSQDCPPGDSCSMVCNVEWGFCQPSDCCMDGCYPNCSPLTHQCFECLGDCDCPADKVCNLESQTCAVCRDDKIHFKQTNEQFFEFYEVCIPRDQPGMVAALQDINPDLYCGMAGVFAGCDSATEISCHGEFLMPAGGADKMGALPDEAWEVLCRMSRLPFVRVIAGGHYLG